jgi:hypothetical protein
MQLAAFLASRFMRGRSPRSRRIAATGGLPQGGRR